MLVIYSMMEATACIIFSLFFWKGGGFLLVLASWNPLLLTPNSQRMAKAPVPQDLCKKDRFHIRHIAYVKIGHIGTLVKYDYLHIFLLFNYFNVSDQLFIILEPLNKEEYIKR